MVCECTHTRVYAQSSGNSRESVLTVCVQGVNSGSDAQQHCYWSYLWPALSVFDGVLLSRENRVHEWVGSDAMVGEGGQATEDVRVQA